jgi:hypothetical protein
VLKDPGGIWQVRAQTERSKGVPRAEVCNGDGRGMEREGMVEVLLVTVIVLVVVVLVVVVVVAMAQESGLRTKDLCRVPSDGLELYTLIRTQYRTGGRKV